MYEYKSIIAEKPDLSSLILDFEAKGWKFESCTITMDLDYLYFFSRKITSFDENILS